jgi:hypothetical protein
VLWSVEGSRHWVAFDGAPTGLVESGRDAECDEAVVRGGRAGVQAGSCVHGSDPCALRACVQASASGALLAVHLTTGPAFQQAELKAAPGSINGPVVCVRLGQHGEAEVGVEQGGWVGGGDWVGGCAGRWVVGSVDLRVGGPAGRWVWVGGCVGVWVGVLVVSVALGSAASYAVGAGRVTPSSFLHLPQGRVCVGDLTRQPRVLQGVAKYRLPDALRAPCSALAVRVADGPNAGKYVASVPVQPVAAAALPAAAAVDDMDADWLADLGLADARPAAAPVVAPAAQDVPAASPAPEFVLVLLEVRCLSAPVIPCVSRAAVLWVPASMPMPRLCVTAHVPMPVPAPMPMPMSMPLSMLRLRTRPCPWPCPCPRRLASAPTATSR